MFDIDVPTPDQVLWYSIYLQRNIPFMEPQRHFYELFLFVSHGYRSSDLFNTQTSNQDLALFFFIKGIKITILFILLRFLKTRRFVTVSLAYAWMRLFEWLERRNCQCQKKVTTVLGLIPVSSDTVEVQGRRSADEAVVKKGHKKFLKCQLELSYICISLWCKDNVGHFRKLTGGFVWIFFMYCIQHCFFCRPSDSTVSEDAGIALAVRRSNHSARSHPSSARFHPHSARSHPPDELLY
jgi:hypothetical protein